jgi:hypothetical protein
MVYENICKIPLESAAIYLWNIHFFLKKIKEVLNKSINNSDLLEFLAMKYGDEFEKSDAKIWKYFDFDAIFDAVVSAMNVEGEDFENDYQKISLNRYNRKYVFRDQHHILYEWF